MNEKTAEDIIKGYQTGDDAEVARARRTADEVWDLKPAEETPPAEDDRKDPEAKAPEGDDDSQPPADDNKEPEDRADDDGDDGDDEEKKRRGKKLSAKERIDQLVARSKTAERTVKDQDETIAELKERLARLEGRAEGEDDGDDLTNDRDRRNNRDDTGSQARPDPRDFEWGEVDPEFITALADWRFDERMREQEQRENEKRSAEAGEVKAQEYRQAVEDLSAKGTEKYDDFFEVVVEGGVEGKYPLSEQVGDMIFESEVGHEVAYYLATNPEVAQEIHDQDEKGQARAFGRLEARFMADQSNDDQEPETPNTPKPKAPPPPRNRPRGSGGRFKPSAATNNFADFKALVESD